jgi:hypothetical protein
VADESGVAVFGGVFVHIDGVDVCSRVCFVDDCGDVGHAFRVVGVTEAMPEDDGEGGGGFGFFEEDFLLGEGEGERKQTEEEREEHNDCVFYLFKFRRLKFEPAAWGQRPVRSCGSGGISGQENRAQ